MQIGIFFFFFFFFVGSKVRHIPFYFFTYCCCCCGQKWCSMYWERCHVTCPIIFCHLIYHSIKLFFFFFFLVWLNSTKLIMSHFSLLVYLYPVTLQLGLLGYRGKLLYNRVSYNLKCIEFTFFSIKLQSSYQKKKKKSFL